MIRRTPLALAAAVAALALQALPAAAFQRGDTAGTDAATAGVTDRLIVKYRSAAAASAPSSAAQSRAAAVARAHGAGIAHLRAMADGAHVFKLDRAQSAAALQQIAQALRNGDADIEYVEPDLMLRPQLVPNDPLYAQQWDLFEATAGMNLPTAWDKSTGAGVVVAVVDTGVRAHADLAPNLLAGYDFITNTTTANDGNGRDADPADPGDWATAGLCSSGSAASASSWHGTHVAGTVAAVGNNAAGVTGVAPAAKVLPVRVLGRCGGYTSDIADGIVWASGGSVTGVPANPTPARVINLSLGGSGSCGSTFQNAITAARNRGALVVVAAGNSNTDASTSTPANCSGVIAVAAVNRSGAKASYSNYGSVVSLAAPGGDTGAGIVSTLNAGSTTPGSDSYAGYMGTSMATPHVAGTAALMLARNPALTLAQLETRLKAAVRPFPAACNGCGSGLLDANAAVDAAAGGSTSTSALSGTAEVEPNNTLASAQTLGTAPQTVQGSIASSADIDHYRVPLAAGARITVKLTGNAAANYNLYAYTAAGAYLGASTLGTGQVDQLAISNNGSTATSVVLAVRWASGSAGSYSLAVQGN